MNKLFAIIVVTMLGAGISACKPGDPQEKDTYKVKGIGAPLTNDEYNKLTPLQQYQVANRLMSTLFKGVPAQEFFDVLSIDGKPEDLQVSETYTNFINKIQKELDTPLENKDSIYNAIVGDTENPGKYTFSSETRMPMELPLAYLYELPISDEFYARWMSYKLMNTILFSPAEEIDSADESDADAVNKRLSTGILGNASVRSIIYAHEISQNNWRRFRSPEDNAREMIEIYLGLFDRDADVPKAAKACKNWYLTDENQGYLLKNPPENNNTEPQLILDNYYVTTCEDVMQAIANHPLVIPRITTVLVDHLMDVGYDSQSKADLVDSIVKSHPETFKDIFSAIIFSKAYLLNMERPKYFEESFFNIANRISWSPGKGFFRDITSNSTGNLRLSSSMLAMNQPSISLKLGRWASVPLDSLGFSYYHRAIREWALINRKTDPFNPANDGQNGAGWGWDANFITGKVDQLKGDDLTNYLFLSVAGRYATKDELDTINRCNFKKQSA